MYLLLLLAMLAASPAPYTGPPPGDPYWLQVLANAGEKALEGTAVDHRVVRLVRVPEALVFATVVTLEPATDGVHVSVKESRDRRKLGAASRSFVLPPQSWDTVRQLADAGLWKQKAVAPTGASPYKSDGVLWMLEGRRGGDHWAIVRHEPKDPAVVALASHLMRLAGLPDEVPR